MSFLRICVIGAGDWATRVHRPAIQRLVAAGRIRVVGVCDLDPARAEAFACATGDLPASAGAADGPAHEAGAAEGSTLQVGIFSDAPAMLDQCRPDGVVILVRPEATAGLIELAAEHRVPFLAEKPPAPDAVAHRRLMDRVGSLTHLVAYNRRHAPYMTQARSWLAGHPIQSITCLFSRYRRRDPDFTTTAVHAIDAVRFLAGSDFAEMRSDIALAAGNDLNPPTADYPPVKNFFLSGWLASGARADILITPDTASAEEHYIVRTADRTVRVAFPHFKTIDSPGYVELHEGNKLISRLGPSGFNIDPADSPALLGIVAEHEIFAAALAGGPAIESTLAATLGTEEIRDDLARRLGEMFKVQ